MLNWIVWNRTDNFYKMDLALSNLQMLICHKAQLNQIIYIQYIYIYMYRKDLEFRNLQMLICHKTQTIISNLVHFGKLFKI